MEAYIGSIIPMAFTYAPVGWMSCEGQVMQISQNTALFSLLGTNYGGNGTSTFQLPDLRGRAIAGQGNVPGSPTYVVGDAQGSSSITLSLNQLPAHSHQVTVNANAFSAATNDPANAYFGGGSTSVYDSSSDGATLSQQCVVAGPAGGNQPINIQNPYVAMYYNICVEGIFPVRN